MKISDKYYIVTEACDKCELCAWSSLVDFEAGVLSDDEDTDEVEREISELWHDCPSGAFRYKR